MADDTVQDLPPVFEDTPHLGLPLPHPGNKLEVDNPRLREALSMIDQVAHDMGQAIEASASQEALQALAQSTGQTIDQLQQQTAQVLLQQALRIQQLAQDIADKSVDLQAVMDASSVAQARAGYVRLAQMRMDHCNSSSNGKLLEAGVEYTIYADAPYSLTLPASPQRGDTIVFLDGWGMWKNGGVTIVRGNPQHEINRRSEDLTIDSNCWFIRLVYVWDGYWMLSMGQDTGGNL